MSYRMYGIPNCDTVKKARKALEDKGVEYVFHDYKKAGVPEELVALWVEEKGWDMIVNTRGMTWRRMSDEEKAAITEAKSAIALMKEKSSVIKRPILLDAKGVLIAVGFDKEIYEAL